MTFDFRVDEEGVWLDYAMPWMAKTEWDTFFNKVLLAGGVPIGTSFEPMGYHRLLLQRARLRVARVDINEMVTKMVEHLTVLGYQCTREFDVAQ